MGQTQKWTEKPKLEYFEQQNKGHSIVLYSQVWDKCSLVHTDINRLPINK